MIALGRALAARGHDVVLQTWRRWEEHVVAEGMRFAAAPEYHVFPTRERPLAPYDAVVRAVGDTRPLVSEMRPDAVVADILTLAPALAAELERVGEQGWAEAAGEREPDLNAVAAPVFDAAGRLAGAVSLIVTVEEMTEERVTALVGGACRTAREISLQLGWRYGATPRAGAAALEPGPAISRRGVSA
jgi:hypothetical protein